MSVALIIATAVSALGAVSGGDTVEVERFEWTVHAGPHSSSPLAERRDNDRARSEQHFQLRNRGKATTVELSLPVGSLGYDDDDFTLKVDHRPIACKDAAREHRCSFSIDRGQPRTLDVEQAVDLDGPDPLPAPGAWTNVPAKRAVFDPHPLATWRNGRVTKAKVTLELDDRPAHLVFSFPAGGAFANGDVTWQLSGWAPAGPFVVWYFDAPGPPFGADAAAAWEAKTKAAPKSPPSVPADALAKDLPSWSSVDGVLARVDAAMRRADAALMRGGCAIARRDGAVGLADALKADVPAFRAKLVAWDYAGAKKLADRFESSAAEAERLAGEAETCQ